MDTVDTVDTVVRYPNIDGSQFAVTADVRFNAHGYLCAIYDREPGETGYMAYVLVSDAHVAVTDPRLRRRGVLHPTGLHADAFRMHSAAYVRIGLAREDARLPSVADAVVAVIGVAHAMRELADADRRGNPQGAVDTVDPSLDTSVGACAYEHTESATKLRTRTLSLPAGW